MALLAARSKALAHGRETGERSAGEIIGKLVAYYSDQVLIRAFCLDNTKKKKRHLTGDPCTLCTVTTSCQQFDLLS